MCKIVEINPQLRIEARLSVKRLWTCFNAIFFTVAWSKKWEESHKKGPEYGALKTAMFGIMVEGEQLADVHNELQEKLTNEVHQTVNQWKKDNYHKSLMSYKEVKTVEEGFSKAQKPWVRRLDEGIVVWFHTEVIQDTSIIFKLFSLEVQ